MNQFGQQQPNLAQQIASLTGSLADTGMTMWEEQERAKINEGRIRSGRQPCTRQPGQPRDCPLPLFAPPPPRPLTPEEIEAQAAMARARAQGGGGGRRGGGSNTMMIVGIVAVAAVLIVVVMMMSKKDED